MIVIVQFNEIRFLRGKRVGPLYDEALIAVQQPKSEENVIQLGRITIFDKQKPGTFREHWKIVFELVREPVFAG